MRPRTTELRRPRFTKVVNQVSKYASAAFLGAAFVFCRPAIADEKLVHSYGSVVLSPDGSRLASIESDEAKVEGESVRQSLVIRPTDGSAAHLVVLPCASSPGCRPSDPVWSPDGKALVFVSGTASIETRALYAVNPNGGGVRKILEFSGLIEQPRYSPNGQLSILATAGAHKEIGATQAGAPIVGEIGGAPDEQRIALVNLATGALHWASPPDLFVYEYDWKPDGSGFVGSAAHGNGDDNWWVAHLYSFDAASGTATDIYAPASPQQQIADPRVSPDQKFVAFVGGIMSDFGSTGGDVYTVPLAGGPATDATPKMAASATSLRWECPGDADHDHLSFTALDGGRYAMHEAWPVANAPQHLGYSFGDANASNVSVACRGTPIGIAFVRQSFDAPPEIYVGSANFGAIHALTHENAGVVAATSAQNIDWHSGEFDVQGWLLAPLGATGTAKHPMITLVHGGPAAAVTPTFVGRGTTRDLLREGYYIFYPNPRGSFGQGEAFTKANVKDFGYGDLRDVLAGVDAVEKTAPVDDARLGIGGGSYGGFMTMWAVTQTQRFKAAVAGAGVSDWLSYYGENGIDEWMIPFFGASVYDDPAVYAKSSPITFIKNVKTPTFEYVGQLDVECPAPQSLEFWHALETLGVPTQLVIYQGEGHHIRAPAHIADVSKRTVAWFDKYLK
jgi:dipeptidyl aminopeptidase/acylaminoacyl peptidase